MSLYTMKMSLFISHRPANHDMNSLQLLKYDFLFVLWLNGVTCIFKCWNELILYCDCSQLIDTACPYKMTIVSDVIHIGPWRRLCSRNALVFLPFCLAAKKPCFKIKAFLIITEQSAFEFLFFIVKLYWTQQGAPVSSHSSPQRSTQRSPSPLFYSCRYISK